MPRSRGPEPLILVANQAIFALDPETGSLRWRASVPAFHRVFRLGERLFVLTYDGVIAIDLDHGRSLGGVDLGFTPTGGIASQDRLFVTGPTGMAALSPSGAVLWSVTRERGSGESPREFLACLGGNGFQQWREEIAGAGGSPGLVYGDQIIQPED